MKVTFHPATPARWPDIEKLFGERGACGGCPVEPKKGLMPDPFVWTGIDAAFAIAGFTEVARRSSTRPIMRLVVREAARTRPSGR